MRRKRNDAFYDVAIISDTDAEEAVSTQSNSCGLLRLISKKEFREPALRLPPHSQSDLCLEVVTRDSPVIQQYEQASASTIVGVGAPSKAETFCGTQQDLFRRLTSALECAVAVVRPLWHMKAKLRG